MILLYLPEGPDSKVHEKITRTVRTMRMKGLKKSYSADIHLWHNGKWDKSGELSQGRAYGVSLPWNNSLLIIGGETAGGKAVTDSVLISVKDNKVTVQN